MPEKKFDLNKALQAARLYTPIEYGYTPQFDISTDDFNNSANNVLSKIDWIGSGVRARKEEQEKRNNLPWYSKLGYAAMTTPMTSGDSPAVSPYASERWMVGDKEGAQSMQKTQDTIGSVAAGLSILGPYSVADFANTAATYGLGSALAAEGLSWGTGTAGYHGGNWLGQKIDNKYGTNITPWLSTLTAIGGGVAGYSGVLRSSPSMIKRMLNEAKKMDWTPEGIVIPDKAPKWRWSRNAQYDHTSKTLELPLFARKSQIGHELGHYIGDVGVADPAMVKGAFVPGYKYSDNASFELNSAEAFADHFKTKLGYPYKGTNKNLVSRQNALNDNIEFYDVTRESARSYELPLEEKLGIPKGERNQPGKPRSPRAVEYDVVDGRPTKEFLDDYHAYVEALKTGGRRIDITDMFDSSWYRQRLLNQGLTEEQADQLILRLKDRVSPENLVVVDGLNSVRNFRRIEDGIPVEMTPERLTLFGRHTTGPGLSGKSLIELSTKADPEEIILHEIGGHRSQPLVADFKDIYLDQALTNLGLQRHMKIGKTSDYGLNWGEVRARALTIAKQMSDAGWNPNSPEQVNVWLNKYIFTNSPKNANQGALYYDRPRFIKAVSEGLKNGGKIK